MKKKSSVSENRQPAKAQGGRKKKQSSQPTNKQAETTSSERDDHIPPIRPGGGSFFLELMHQLAPTGNGNDSDHRPMIYSATSPDDEQYGAISRVKVFTEIEDDVEARFIPGPGPLNVFNPAQNVELRIWLQKVKRRGRVERDFDNIPPNRAPEVVIRGGPPLIVELDNDLEDRQPTHKVHRRNRYRHKGYGRRFRIGKWRIVDAMGNTRGEGSGGENYDFLVFFFEPRLNKSDGK